MKSFEFCIFIGRFAPFHKAHYSLLKEALNQAETVLVVLGSHNKARDIRNPWSSSERTAMIKAALTDEELLRVKFIPMRDYLYSDNSWISTLQNLVSEATNDSESVALIGHEHDKSSYYLKLFPQWQLLSMKNNDQCPHATHIRSLYFTHDMEYKKYLHAQTTEYLENFKSTDKFKQLKDEFDFLREYTLKWEGAPFKPIFHTVDCIVIKSGHVLLVRRKGKLGKGLLALPGGFLNSDERIKDGALRELKEETVIKVSKEELEMSIVDQKVFDHPLRSTRGRTLTTAFLINLKSGALPKVKGSDDADKAFWLPLNEIMQREEEFFEDHFHIINYFCNKF